MLCVCRADLLAEWAFNVGHLEEAEGGGEGGVVEEVGDADDGGEDGEDGEAQAVFGEFVY